MAMLQTISTANPIHTYMRIILLILVILTISHPTASFAQADQERIDQLERDVLILQRQLARRAAEPSAAVDDVTGMATSSGTNSVGLEEEIRSLRGKIEEKDFETRRVSEQLELFKKDAEFRLQALEQGAQAAPASAPAALAAAPTAAHGEIKPLTPPNKNMEISVKKDAGEDEKPAAEAAPQKFENARDHYNYAFRLLNQNQYDEASQSFNAFIKQYPKDPLVGNAYYWLGETHYIRNQFDKATDNFRQGFESMPKGPKAVDNLLKLGMSLARDSKKKEACIVLSQVMTRYKDVSAGSATKAAAEHKRIGCE